MINEDKNVCYHGERQGKGISKIRGIRKDKWNVKTNKKR